MPRAPLPPYGEPSGARFDDDELVGAFVDGALAGASPTFHVEGSVLFVARVDVVALRIASSAFLVRTDLPDDVADVSPTVARVLAARGLSLLDEATLLATPVALQVVGLRIAEWDLWGDDIDEAFAALRAAASGERTATVFTPTDALGGRP